MSYQIVKKVGFDLELDEAHTRPHGWIRFIDPDDCRNIAYFNFSALMEHQNGIDLFEFKVEQYEDIWLQKAKTLCCVCEKEKRLLVVVVKNDLHSITIGIVDDVPKLYAYGADESMIRYFWIDKKQH